MKTKEEIEQLAFLKYPIIRGYIANNMDSEYDKNKDFRDCFIKGYTKCQQDMVEKYTEQDMIKFAFDTYYQEDMAKKYTEEDILRFLNFYNEFDFNKLGYRYRHPSMDGSEKKYNQDIHKKIIKHFIESLNKQD